MSGSPPISIFAIILLALGFIAARGDGQTCVPPTPATDGFWVSSSATNEIYRFDAVGSPLGSFTLPGLSAPRSITVTPSGEVYVASQFSNEILVCDPAATFSHSFTAPALSGPTGGAIGPSGDYFVCSFNTDEVLRFDSSEQLLTTYSSPGLNGPNCIVFRTDGGFFVTGQISNDVHSFAPDGSPLGSFPTGQLSVMGAAIDLTGRLLVAGGSSDEVRLFDCAGTVLETWNVPGGPQSIAVRSDGTVFVTTFFSSEVRWYTGDGVFIDNWTGGIQIRGIEFFPGGSFLRGDPNGDGGTDLADAISILAVLFSGGERFSCADAADVNDDGAVDVADPIALLAYLFSSGPVPPEPFGSPGVDPTPDGLSCLD